MNRMRVFSLLAMVLLVAGCSPWFLGSDNRTPPTELVDIQNPLHIEKLWQTEVGSGADGAFVKLTPAVADGRIYAASHDGVVVALNATSGALVWKVKTKRSISAGVGLSEQFVLLGTPKGQVIAIQREDGKEAWQAQVSSEVLAAPRAADGVVVVRTVDGKFIGLDAASGTRLWTYQYTVPVLSLRGTSPPVLAQGVVISGLDTGKLLVLSLREGVPLFEKTIAPSRGRTELERMVDIDAEPKVVGSVLFIAAYQGNISAVDLRNGNIVWTREGSSYAGLDAEPGYVFVADTEDTILALNWRDGESLWQQTGLTGRQLSTPVIDGEYVVVGDFEGYLHWLAKDSGKLVGRVEVDDEGILSAPVSSGNVIYVYGKGGALSAFQVGTATL